MQGARRKGCRVHTAHRREWCRVHTEGGVQGAYRKGAGADAGCTEEGKVQGARRRVVRMVLTEGRGGGAVHGG